MQLSTRGGAVAVKEHRCAALLVARAAIDYTAALFMHGIALARRLPADSSARVLLIGFEQQLGRRKFVHRGQAADTSLRPEMPIPAPSHQGRLIHKSWSRDYDCGRCCVYLPIAYFARWCGCPSKACFDQFSLALFTPDYSDSTMSIVLMSFIATVMDPFLVGAVTNDTRPSPTSTRGLA